MSLDFLLKVHILQFHLFFFGFRIVDIILEFTDFLIFLLDLVDQGLHIFSKIIYLDCVIFQFSNEFIFL